MQQYIVAFVGHILSIIGFVQVTKQLRKSLLYDNQNWSKCNLTFMPSDFERGRYISFRNRNIWFSSMLIEILTFPTSV